MQFWEMPLATFTGQHFIWRIEEEGDRRAFTKDFLKLLIFFFFNFFFYLYVLINTLKQYYIP